MTEGHSEEALLNLKAARAQTAACLARTSDCHPEARARIAAVLKVAVEKLLEAVAVEEKFIGDRWQDRKHCQKCEGRGYWSEREGDGFRQVFCIECKGTGVYRYKVKS